MRRAGGIVRWLARVGIFTTAIAVTLGAAPHLQDRAPPIGVEVEGKIRYLRPDATLGHVQQRFHLRAEAGDLLDVDGLPIEVDVYPGEILVDGERGVSWQRLHDGAVVEVVHGQDRTEPVVEEVRVFPAGVPHNPQFILSRQPGEQVTTKGRISGKIVAVVFRPTGEARVPPAVALTFDDGPHPIYTPQILGILERRRVPATFFVVGYLAERFPKLIEREARIGTVASHTWGHPISPPFKDMKPKRVRDEMRRGIAAVEERGLKVRLFRPPGGSYDDGVMRIAQKMGLRLVMWSVDPQDWRNDATKRQIVRSVIGNIRPGAIVLLHDGGGDQSATVEALPVIIRKIRQMGLRFALLAPQG